MAQKNNEKINKKKLLLIAIFFIVILVVIFVVVKINNNEDENKSNISIGENGTVNNISKNIYETKNVEQLYEITCKSLKYENSATKAVIKIKNVSGVNSTNKLAKIVFLDRNGKELSNMSVYIKTLQVNEEYETTATIGANIVDAYDYKITFTK